MRIKYIDVLKAFAIIAVVLYHAGFMKYGYLGVDLFLVIAGYLTTKSLLKNEAINNPAGGEWTKNYLRFEISRIIRLLPPLIIAGIVCMVCGFFVMIDDTYESLSQSVIATSFFGNNIVELVATGDYWADSKAFSPLMHTWYVGLVMQFYLILPLFFLLTRFNKNNSVKTFLTIVVIFSVLSLILFVGDSDTARKFYLLPARFFEFGAGSIVAVIYKPRETKILSRFFVWVCYLVLLAVFFINKEFVPANVKLLFVVFISCIMLCSQDVLENGIFGNTFLAKVGGASYSIFIWHQVVLAFMRSFVGSHLNIAQWGICMGIVVVLSWASYLFIEQRLGMLIKSSYGKIKLYIVYGVLFIALNLFSIYIYIYAGVVRDIPELEVYKNNPQRGKWSDYNEKIRKLDQPFKSDKSHWLVIGNSFGRDFANIVMESVIADTVEISYCDATGDRYLMAKYDERFKSADKIFVASKNFTQEMVREIEIRAKAFGHPIDDVIIVGEKNFGETMTQIYVRRFRDDYFSTKIKIEKDLFLWNDEYKQLYRDRYIDMLACVSDNTGEVRAFTDDGMFLSSDCVHLTRAGAKYFAKKIDWDKYLDTCN